MFNTAVISVLTSLSVLWFLFRRNHTKQVEPRDQPSIVPSSRPCGLPDLYPVFPRDGLKGNTNVDIIAVHGIETCSPTTWTAYERDEEPRGRKINWLVDDDMLPSVVPNARIWVFDYNSRYSRDAQEVGIKDLGAVFLRFLWDKKHELGTRPIVFIGSCFGGILITQALQMAASESEKYIQLLQYTKGVIFLGTPLRGTRVKSPAEWRVFISAMWDANHEPSTTLLEDLGENSSNLESIVEAFGKSTIKHEIEIRCFYETRTTQILNAVLRRSVSKWSKPTKIMLVERRSACLDCHEQIPLEVPHAMMNKYRGPDDGNFKLVSGRIKEIFQKTQDIQHRTKEQLTCLQSLSRNYREYKDTNPKRVVGTCEWLLGHEKFLKWRDESVENLLWVSADPGCGKSVLSRALVDERLLTPKEPPAQAQSICYFFFKEGDNERCNAVDALCAILHQLFTQRPALLKHVMNDFENNGVKICNMFGTLWDVLVKATTDPDAGQVVCVLDALDECEESTRKALIQKLGELDLTRHEMRTKTKLKFVVTSRPYENIRRAFHSAVPDVLSINLRGEDESEMIKISNEIDLVILDQVPRIARARDIPIGKDIEEILINSLRNMDNRTYLWLHLILDEVRNTLESSEGKLNKLLAEIPSSVDAAYERILNRVTEKRLVRQARTLLHIVVSAERPLTWREMNIVLAVLEKQEGKNCNSEKELELDSRDAFKTKVRNLCGLFVSIIDSKVYLIHQTAREFLLSEHRIGTHFDHTRTGDSVWKQSLLLEDSNRLILNACILYLLLNVFETDPLEGMDEYRYCSQHSFLDYAAKHWASHFREANIREEEALLESILKVCNHQSNRFRTWFQLYWTTNHPYTNLPGFNDLIVGSYFGHEAIVRLLLEKGADIETKDTYGRTPLLWAAKNGYDVVVQLLLEKGADFEIKDKEYSQTPLLWAAKNGYDVVVQLLLEKGADFEIKDTECSQTPLLWAAECGHDVVVRLLLKKGASIETKDNLGRTPLWWAAKEGHDVVVRLLLEKGADFEIKDKGYSQTPLSWAAMEGHDVVVRLLLEKGASIETKANRGRTPLSLATKKGHDVVVRLLLEKGASFETG